MTDKIVCNEEARKIITNFIGGKSWQDTVDVDINRYAQITERCYWGDEPILLEHRTEKVVCCPECYSEAVTSDYSIMKKCEVYHG